MGWNTITPAGLQVPPLASGASAMSVTGPPVAAIFSNLRRAKTRSSGHPATRTAARGGHARERVRFGRRQLARMQLCGTSLGDTCPDDATSVGRDDWRRPQTGVLRQRPVEARNVGVRCNTRTGDPATMPTTSGR